MGCFPACFSCSASKRRKSIPSKEYQGLRSPKLIQSTEQAKREEDLLIKLVKESKEEVENQDKCGSKKRVTFDLLENNEDERQKSVKEDALKEMEPLSDAIPLIEVSGSGPNYRYRDSDEEEYGDIDGQESSESLFSLSLDSRKRGFDSEIGENEVNSGPIQIRALSKAIELSEDSAKRPRLEDESVLKPIENLSRLKDEVDRPIARNLRHDQKENIISLEPSLKPKYHSSKPKLFEETKLARQAIGVDTSFSSWLIGSENSPMIGTVESYWAHTGQELDSEPNSSLLKNANFATRKQRNVL